MDTLYDLLGALPRDDAEGLRTAFRRAVKSAHPDLKPGDPDAALRFRQIVRAHGILTDAEQRAAYDHLLALAQLEKEQAAKLPIAATVHRVASGVMTFAVASIVSVASFLLLMHLSSTTLVATANNAEATSRVPAETASATPTEPARPAETNASEAKPETTLLAEVITTGAAAVPNVNSAPVLGLAALPASVPDYATFFHARGVFAYRNGDFSGAIADLDQAIQLDPNLSVSYIDRGIVFYRLRKFDRAFADIAHAKQIENKQIEKQTHPAKPASVIAAKPHSEKSASPPAAVPSPPRRPVVAVGPPPRYEHYYYSRRWEPLTASFN
jgi:tetratricopeptide (TPR) repeat protein